VTTFRKRFRIVSTAGLPDFSWCMIPKPGKMYQMNTICTKWSWNIPNLHKVFQMAIKYKNIFQSQGPPTFTQIGIFGMKTKHIWQPWVSRMNRKIPSPHSKRSNKKLLNCCGTKQSRKIDLTTPLLLRH
jgi:hypothetical protein